MKYWAYVVTARGKFFFLGVMSLLHAHEGCRLSFDTMFPSSLYKKALDESNELWSDILALREGAIPVHHRTSMADIITGRFVRLSGVVDELACYQQQTGACMHDDGVYLISILDRLFDAYQSIEHARHYRTFSPLYVDMRRTLLHAFGQ